MFERLTGTNHKELGFHTYVGAKNPYSVALTLGELLLSEDITSPRYSPRAILDDVFNRLAAYEDSGLSPEQVQGFAKAEREGRIVVLPVKVGENCFAVNHTEKKIVEITVSEYSYSIWHDAWIVSAANGCQFFLDNTYRTREAAEKAIAEAKRAAEEAFAEAFCNFAESHANREFERQMREGWEG